MDWTAIGAAAAAVLALGLLAISHLRARREAARFRVLDEIARASDRASDLGETLDAIVEILVPAVADICAIDVIRDGRAERAASRVSAQGGEDAAGGVAARRPSTPAAMVDADDGDLLQPRFIPRIGEKELRELAHGEADLEFLRSLGLRSSATAALRARGRVIGAVTLTTAWSGRRYRRHDAGFARVLSGRIALALDNAGLFADLERAERERAEIAATLQRGLAPPPLPRIPGWSAAAMYRPAGDQNEVGGDFYDAFPINGGWMLVIGDVTGKGAAAASITAQARYTLRTAAWLSGDPLVALSTLNSALLAREDSALCSAIAFTLSSDSRDPVRLAVAGHLPPLLIDDGSVTEIAESGPVLGAFGDASWELERASVEPGQQLVAVTDGVTEACGPGGRFGEQRLRAELGGGGQPAAALGRLESALRDFTDGRMDDDAAALAIAPSSRVRLAA
ncbi:MAG TPA: GAF domain-containing SpoIIE family protein phosphatase [Solirubrobacterales bacterium]|nr:GAF domain-containing SpoIIE family protein phosphatase [Solirubrobacterales bacterium]